jgi:hypothetical protein
VRVWDVRRSYCRHNAPQPNAANLPEIGRARGRQRSNNSTPRYESIMYDPLGGHLRKIHSPAMMLQVAIAPRTEVQ